MIPPELVSARLDELKPYMAIACEVQTIDFSWRAHYGPWIKMRIEDGELLHDLKPGQRFVMMLVKLGDDEMPAAANPQDRKPMKLSQQAGYLCTLEEFRQWVTETYGDPCNDKDEAAVWLREACGIESRSFLDSNETAGDTFRAIIKSYDEWKQQQDPSNG